MKLRSKKDGSLASSSSFNTHSMSEIVVFFEEGDCSSEFPSDYEFFLENSQQWVEFSDPRIIPDNYNTSFKEASNQEEINKGYY